MLASELTKKLLAEGCTPESFAVLSRQSDAYCLDRLGGAWAVFYSERGIDANPIYWSSSEIDACRFFYDYILNLEHWHLVGFFIQETKAQELEHKLKKFGVGSIRNDIPAFNTANAPRYRVFVVGKDIFKAKDHLGTQVIKCT
ncbi:SPOR domain-containing protein [Shewanella sp. KX20019]|uniref:SPOR domain-containing protein n=1 Tax=Shewanella sp. KX20019 TaxID=2803864 RepID=UPI0019267A04|nr:SPOR domain-containing protein [Shewanella sp. KX20019]QQX79818.1 SPOR domain-containing protein [Shewanella sp. KX20019]